MSSLRQKRSRRYRLTKRSTALHESAHAVVAHHLGYRVTSICLRANFSGRVTRQAVPVHGARPKPVRPCPIEEAIISLAGMVAEYRARTLSRRLMTYDDARTLERAGVSRHALRRVLEPATDRLVRQLWSEVRRVARELESLRWPVVIRSQACARLLGETA